MSLSPHLLRNLHISPDQAAVYTAALELGQSTIQEIAKKSGVKRTSIYNFLDEMRERGLLVTSRKKKRNVYSATNPEQLVEMEKARLVDLQKTIPELMAFANRSRKKPRVTFYEGIDGMKDVYANILQERHPMVGWSDFEHNVKVMGRFYETYVPERARRNISYHVILRDTPAAREWAKGNRGALRETKFIPSDQIRTEINIYGHKVVLMSFRSLPPIGVMIEDANIASTLRFAWQQLWDRL